MGKEIKFNYVVPTLVDNTTLTNSVNLGGKIDTLKSKEIKVNVIKNIEPIKFEPIVEKEIVVNNIDLASIKIERSLIKEIKIKK